MKKLFLISATILIAASSFSQAKFGFKGGLNLAKQSASGDVGSGTSPTLTAFHAGIILEFGNKLAFQPGFLFSQKGWKDGDLKLTLNYIEVPLNFLYKIGEENTKFFIQAGPYLGYAVSGSLSTGGQSVDVLGSDPGFYKNLDYGIGFGAGLDLSGFQISAQYSLGLANIINLPDGASGSMKNNVISISVAYLFGGN